MTNWYLQLEREVSEDAKNQAHISEMRSKYPEMPAMPPMPPAPTPEGPTDDDLTALKDFARPSAKQVWEVTTKRLDRFIKSLFRSR
jgi:hypothetical protein